MPSKEFGVGSGRTRGYAVFLVAILSLVGILAFRYHLKSHARIVKSLNLTESKCDTEMLRIWGKVWPPAGKQL